jgi:hypothetical protein
LPHLALEQALHDGEGLAHLRLPGRIIKATEVWHLAVNRPGAVVQFKLEVALIRMPVGEALIGVLDIGPYASRWTVRSGAW